MTSRVRLSRFLAGVNPLPDETLVSRIEAVDESTRVFDIFNCLNQLPQLEKDGDGAFDVKKMKKRTQKYAKKLIEALMWRGANRSWPVIFHERMVEAMDVMPDGAFAYYRELGEWFLSSSLMSEHRDKSKQSKTKKLVMDFFDHLDTHIIDPDNAMIGLKPSKYVMEKYSLFKDDDVASSSLRAGAPDTTREALLSTIMEWSALPDRESVASAVMVFAKQLRTHNLVPHSYSRGDLVVVRLRREASSSAPGDSTPQSPSAARYKILFARCVKSVSGSDSVIVRTTSQEEGAKSVNISDARPVPDSIRTRMGNAVTMQQCIESPIEVYCLAIEKELQRRSKEFLRQYSIDVDLVERARRDQVSILDFDAVRRLGQELDVLQQSSDSNVPTAAEEFIANLTQWADARVHMFVAEIDKMPLFRPTCDSEMRKLLRFPHKAGKVFRDIVAVAQSTDKFLRKSMDEFIEGKRKADLTEWWLKLIDHRVDKFLEDRGFILNAIPEDYIEERPEDFDAIRHNLAILKLAIKPSTDLNGEMLVLVNKLKAEIMPKIDEFVCVTISVLAHRLNLPGDKPNVANVVRTFCTQRSTLPEETQVWMENAIKDIGYLIKMKKMEAGFDPTHSQKLALTDVVPISGLIIGRLHILENMINTCMDVWSDSPTCSAPVPLISRPTTSSMSTSFSSASLVLLADGTESAPSSPHGSRTGRLSSTVTSSPLSQRGEPQNHNGAGQSSPRSPRDSPNTNITLAPGRSPSSSPRFARRRRPSQAEVVARPGSAIQMRVLGMDEASAVKMRPVSSDVSALSLDSVSRVVQRSPPLNPQTGAWRTTRSNSSMSSTSSTSSSPMRSRTTSSTGSTHSDDEGFELPPPLSLLQQVSPRLSSLSSVDPSPPPLPPCSPRPSSPRAQSSASMRSTSGLLDVPGEAETLEFTSLSRTTSFSKSLPPPPSHPSPEIKKRRNSQLSSSSGSVPTNIPIVPVPTVSSAPLSARPYNNSISRLVHADKDWSPPTADELLTRSRSSSSPNCSPSNDSILCLDEATSPPPLPPMSKDESRDYGLSPHLLSPLSSNSVGGDGKKDKKLKKAKRKSKKG
eukprot:TRINITY_DN6778_c0_g1_i1.p1 TRINITY_DN6778_c0_g1~~TRINITY_DN6778_c0_g1_i1.p1  ORF type:complete len:1084 (-),score=300.94 TRINITY_DN6778_c0_g1_i1:78-3329(-)